MHGGRLGLFNVLYEWKLKTRLNLSCLLIDRSVDILGEKRKGQTEKEAEAEANSLLIGIPGDSNADVCVCCFYHTSRLAK